MCGSRYHSRQLAGAKKRQVIGHSPAYNKVLNKVRTYEIKHFHSNTVIERKTKMKTYMNEKAGKHFCFRLTSDDMDIAVPMLLTSILMLLAVVGVC